MDSQVTLNEIMTAVRELTFDRFIIPAFALKQKDGCNIVVQPTTEGDSQARLEITNIETSETVFVAYFSECDTMEKLMNKLIDSGIIVAYTPYFRGEEPTSSLIKVTKSLDEDFTAFRRYFFSDNTIKDMICWYYQRVLDIINVNLTDDTVGKLIRPSEKHLAIWVSYFLVDKRRMYESAAQAIGQTFTDGSNYVGSTDSSGAGITTTVQIGSVFSIQEDPSKGYYYEDFNRVGSDNVWGDRYSFWYKLMLYLRGLLEDIFGDYSLRKDNVIPGYIVLSRELDFRSYYDSYPFTLSPLSRGILSKTP